MWNRLSEGKISKIIMLHREGLSYPQIARRLRVHRETVGRHVRKLKEPTRVVSIGLYSSDLKKLRRQAKKQKKPVTDLIREIVHQQLTS